MKVALTTVRQVTERLDSRYEEMMSQINESFDQLTLTLAERRQALLSAVGEIHAAKRTTLAQQTRAFDDVISAVSGSCEFAREVLEHGSEMEVRNVGGG